MSDKTDKFHAILSGLYSQREPDESEISFFNSNPEVAGMATDDKRVVLNPIGRVAPGAFESVARNERVRLLLDDRKLDPAIGLTKGQIRKARSWGGPYGENPKLLRQTLIGRILSDDDSLAPYTKEQQDYASKLVDHVLAAGK